jgi:hypothetical protein
MKTIHVGNAANWKNGRPVKVVEVDERRGLAVVRFDPSEARGRLGTVKLADLDFARRLTTGVL